MYVRWHVAAVAAALVAACTTTVRISRDELQADLARHLPYEVDQHLVALRARQAQVELPGPPDRIAVRLQLDATSKSGHSRVPITVRAEGRIDYVATEHAFYLREPRVTELALGSGEGDGTLARAVQHARSTLEHELVDRAARAAVTELLRAHPVYQLDPRRAKEARAIRHLRSAHVEGQELVLEVGW